MLCARVTLAFQILKDICFWVDSWQEGIPHWQGKLELPFFIH
jgi:hypothetical protein